MSPASLCNPRLTHWCCHRGSVGGHTTCCWTPPYSFYIFKVAVSLCKVHSRPVKRFSGSASLTCEENSGRDRNVQMHFTLFQVLAGITRLPHCCVTLALPLCLPIMSYYKLQRPEFNTDNVKNGWNLTPTYNTIPNTDGTVRSPKGKSMRAAADSDVIQRHIVLGAEFLQLKKAKYIVSCIIITIKIESASGVSTSELTSAEHICITGFFFFYNSFTEFKDPFFYFYFAFLSLCLKTNTRTGNLYQTMCSPPKKIPPSAFSPLLHAPLVFYFIQIYSKIIFFFSQMKLCQITDWEQRPSAHTLALIAAHFNIFSGLQGLLFLRRPIVINQTDFFNMSSRLKVQPRQKKADKRSSSEAIVQG